MLELRELVCKRDQRLLFEPISFSSEAGSCIELKGANGSGKTTLLRTLAGLHQQYEGVFTCEDVLYQGHRLGLDELMTPVENLLMHAHLQGLDADDDEIWAGLSRVGMQDHVLTQCRQLSQGQQRRVAMARWLMSDAKTWLLDEPLTALDAQGQALLKDVLSRHCATGGIALCATHNSLGIDQAVELELTTLEHEA